MSDIDKKIADLERACRCLYIEVAESVANDVKQKAEAVINQLKACREEKAKLIEYYANPPTFGESYEVDNEQD